MATATRAGISVRSMKTTRSSTSAGTREWCGATNSAPTGVSERLPIQTGSSRQAPGVWRGWESSRTWCICRIACPESSPERSIAAIIDRVNSRRSEEHTSELQSRGHLVCRLLLEKKKKTKTTHSQCEELHRHPDVRRR